MKKVVLIIVFFLSLSACNSCFSPMPVIPCGYTDPDVSLYVKNVNHEEKMIDIRNCLGEDSQKIPNESGYIFKPIKEKYGDTVYAHEKIRAFDKCMQKEKGYIYKEVWR
ncbi:hypothetical protein [Neisseria iguanae]|uniref:Lipoprotein n=1 Tax=Neisseria iguanae TaxID=90242 RepID=A0A2P7TYG0_9NEIS|nr:hypothetical protein [Neisseria iguanae]PSJ79735.1 hypothetical protein C7N83_10475 [Neisseria iguanae]